MKPLEWAFGQVEIGKERNFTRCKVPLKIQDDETQLGGSENMGNFPIGQ